MQNGSGNRIHIWALAIFILAFALRIIHVVSIYRGSPFFDVLPGDLGAYDRWARRIVDHGWLGRDVFYQDPLYPYFLALFYKVFGRDFSVIYLFQSFLGAMTSLLLVFLGSRVFSRSTGIFGGLLYAVYGPAIYFDGLILKVTLAAFLLTLAVYFFLIREPEDPGPSHYWAGFFLGLACLARANFLLLLPVAFSLVFGPRNILLRKRLTVILLFTVGAVTSLVPVLARNYVVGQELVLTTAQAGQNFFIGHNPEANGTYIKLDFVRADPLHEQEDFLKEAEKRTGKELNPGEVSRYWLYQGLDYVRSHPLQDLKLTGRKILFFFNNYEIPDNHNYYFHQRYSPVLRILPVSFGMVAPFLLLGLLGMLFSGRTGPRFCFLIQVIYTASVILFYVFSRYRMVILPLFCLTAGYGLFMLQDQFNRARWRQLILSLLVVILGFGVANMQVITPFDFSHSFTDEGIAYELKGKEQKAIESYRQALAVNPGYLRALERMGRLQLQQEDYEGARATYAKILRIDPDSVETKYQLMLLDKMGL